MLRAEALTKAYRGRTVVQDVDIELANGRVVGLVGANGAGKTTTIKMLAGLLEPTSGTVRIDGASTLEPATRRHLGYLPEESPLYDELTAMQYLTFFGSLYDVPRDESRRRATALMDRLDLAADDRGKVLGTMSKGMRRKVAIARCLLHDPAVLLLDEPTSGLDPFTASELNAFIRELRDQGHAVLLSAHDLPQVEMLCDEILIMDRGRTVTRGTLTELRDQWGQQRYEVHATAPFPGSQPRGTGHVGTFTSLQDVEAAFEHIRRADGTVLEVESVFSGLDEILRTAASGG